MVNLKETPPKVLALYFTSICLGIMGILSFINGIPILSFFVGIFTIIAAACGFVGAWMNSFKLLWVFMVGCMVVALLTIISLIFSLIGTHWFSVAVNALELLILAAGWFVAFIVRGRSFQWGFINLGPDAKKPSQPLSSVV
eukprot:Phypoly_transcript_22107.p1 GENE.Phypoly_transcript_22107~~Phypoly_transcript_22107.p1  ORF type:complete len:141 (+),score=10.86 Phypoly_transcript_22107:61-483(+)